MSMISKLKEFNHNEFAQIGNKYLLNILKFREKKDRNKYSVYLTEEKERELLQAIPQELKNKYPNGSNFYKKLFSFLLKEIAVNNSITFLGYNLSKNEGSCIKSQSSKLFFLSNRIKYNKLHRP